MEQTNNVASSLKTFDTSTKHLAVFVGKKDRVFTLQECTEALSSLLGEAGKGAIIPLEGGHSTVGSKRGQAQLRHVAMWLAGQYPNR